MIILEAGLVKILSVTFGVWCSGRRRMGAARVAGCLIVMLFSCYLWLLAERGRKYLVGQPEIEGAFYRGLSAVPSNQTQFETLGPAEKSSVWLDIGINFFVLISTFLCYDLLVTNLLLVFLASDQFFLFPASKATLSAMLGVLAAGAWFEVPHFAQSILHNWSNS